MKRTIRLALTLAATGAAVVAIHDRAPWRVEVITFAGMLVTFAVVGSRAHNVPVWPHTRKTLADLVLAGLARAFGVLGVAGLLVVAAAFTWPSWGPRVTTHAEQDRARDVAVQGVTGRLGKAAGGLVADTSKAVEDAKERIRARQSDRDEKTGRAHDAHR